MPRHVPIVVLGVMLAATAVAGQRRQDVPPWDPSRLEGWLRIVEAHEPGQIDPPLIAATAWARDDLHELWIETQVLLRVVADPRDTRFRVLPLDAVAGAPAAGGSDQRRTLRFSPVERQALDRVAARVRELGMDSVLKRAVLVHTDVATLTPDRVAVSSGPTLMNAPLRMMVGDGQSAGAEAVSAHWDLARLFARSIAPAAPPGPWVRDWYRATLAFGQRVESFDSIHLRHALRVLPDDPGVLFFAACQHEAFASPLMQEFARGFRTTRLKPDIEDERDELHQAETLFRRALAGDPTHHEARLRLGRVLSLTGRDEAAVVELSRVLRDTGDPQLQYYAALFLGAAHEGIANPDAARLAYERAAALVPDAPAAHLSLARLAQRMGDRSALTERLSRALRPPTPPGGNDPWWAYRAAQGRNAGAQLDEVRRNWKRVTP